MMMVVVFMLPALVIVAVVFVVSECSYWRL